MNIQEGEVKEGDYYLTPFDQLRKVTGIEIDNKGRMRVLYVVKSINILNTPFGFQGTKANHSLLMNFAKKCDKKLSSSEIQSLRDGDILLDGE